MYRVLLVDDEPTIREGLRTLIPWEEMGFRVIDTAANGHEALQKCRILLPDLLIADIRMPGMNGLELVNNLRKLELNMHILILSGYADFEYAKQAIALRIDGYLLKPVDEDELISYLNKLREQLTHDSAKKRARADERETGMERVIQSLLTEDEKLTIASSADEDSLHWETYEVVLIKPITRNEVVTANQTIIKHKLEALFDQRERGIVFAMEPCIGILLKNGVGDDWNRRILYKDISEACLGQVLDFTAVSGGAVHTWADIILSYRQALNLMKNKFYHKSDVLISVDSNSTPQQVTISESCNESLLLEAIDSIYLALEVGNLEAVQQLIMEMAERMHSDGFTEEEFKNMFTQLFSSVLDKFSRNRSEIQSLEYRSRIMDIHKEQRYNLLLERLNSIAKSIVDSLGDTGNDKQIKRMIDLIHRNYGENLKLEKLAELFNYNSAYLGKLFKQATGDHFNTYLDKVRIEQAKLLLEQGYKVYQVAEKVGYANVDYFHAKFRKYVDTSPSSYKKKE
ncbi:response regulator [Cohnella sp.]|uniref:response regulator transcription factor n=1 Tax=Cohnella sp. TaxID=1883426 RepID=UPI003562B880